MNELPLEDQDNHVYQSDEIAAAIVGKYPTPAWVTLREVRDGTGAYAARSSDMMAFGVWPSRGFQVLGFEIKSFRSDWLRELANPEKAESIAQYCDEWWLVTGPGVAKIEEIPAAWGWYVCGQKGLNLVKRPKAEKPVEIDRVFLMSIVRNISRAYVPASQVKKLAEQCAEQLVKSNYDENARKLARYAEMEKAFLDFKTASGIDLERNSWREDFPAEVGAVVKAVLSDNLPYQIKQIEEVALRAQEIMAAVMALPYFKARAEQKKKLGKKR